MSTPPQANAQHTDKAALPAQTMLGAVTLVVRDLAGTAAWYADALGLVAKVDAAAGCATIADADGTVLLELREDPEAVREQGHAGLYHVALNTSERSELARMVRRIAATQTPISGASDHGTHEALYLNDAEGNGLELAVDRAPEYWQQWGTQPLDIEDLLSTIADEPLDLQHTARGMRVGHLHLQTGDLAAMRSFYSELIGFELQFELPSAWFASAGGYHHHVGCNNWIGAGAPAATPGAAGLHHWRIHVPTQADVAAVAARLEQAGYAFELLDDGHELALADPSGIQLRLSCRQPSSST